VVVEHIEIVAIASVIPASDGLRALKRADRQPFPNADAIRKNVINAKKNICQINLAHTKTRIVWEGVFECQGQEGENMQSSPAHSHLVRTLFSCVCGRWKVSWKVLAQWDKWHL